MPKVTKKNTTPVTKPTRKAKVTSAPVKVTPVFKESKFTDKNLQISPRKLRLLANNIKNLSPLKVLDRLPLTNTKSARILYRAVKTAVATAKNNYNLDANSLIFKSIEVGEGQKIKRMDKSHGARFARGIIMRRHSRLSIVLMGQVKSTQ